MNLAERTFGAVICDMDGTLIDSTPAVIRSWVTWADEYGIAHQDLLGRHGRPAADSVAELVPSHRYEEALARIAELEVNDVADIVVLPGVLAALTAIPAAQLAIATSCTQALAEARISAAQLPRPDVLVTVDDVTRGKPDPEPFLLAAARLGVEPADCLVLEDAPAGLTAAKAAGMASLAVTTTTPATDLAADLVVPDLGHVQFETIGGRIRLRRSPAADPCGSAPGRD